MSRPNRVYVVEYNDNGVWKPYTARVSRETAREDMKYFAKRITTTQYRVRCYEARGK